MSELGGLWIYGQKGLHKKLIDAKNKPQAVTHGI